MLKTYLIINYNSFINFYSLINLNGLSKRSIAASTLDSGKSGKAYSNKPYIKKKDRDFSEMSDDDEEDGGDRPEHIASDASKSEVSMYNQMGEAFSKQTITVVFMQTF